MMLSKSSFLKSAAEMLNLPQDTVVEYSAAEQELIYSSAFSYYEAEDYTKASDFFMQLVLSNPFCEKYWRGLASSRQMEKKFLDALHAWCLSALLKDEDPYPHFHAAECLLSLQDKEEALKALDEAEMRAKKDGIFFQLQGKIALLKQVHFSK